MDMDIETDGQTAGTEAPALAEASQVETNSEATAEQNAGTETPESPDAGAEQEPKRVPWFQKRIDEVTRQKYDAQREADYWRGLAEGRSQAQQPAIAQQQDGPPREDQFEDYDAYQAALIDYRVEQRIARERENAQREAVVQTYQGRVNAAREKFADYDAVVCDPSLPISPLMAEVIKESELGPEVAYHLGTNRSEAQRIAALPPHRQAAELGKLEAKLTAAPAPQSAPRTPPPPPPKTVSGLSAGLTKDPSEMSMAEYVAWRKAN
jgi:hypothetical protein